MFSWHFVLRRGLQISAGKKCLLIHSLFSRRTRKHRWWEQPKTLFSWLPLEGLYIMILVLVHCSQFDSAQWHFFQQPNSSTELLPIEWNKHIVGMLYFYWNIFCLSLTTAGNACIRKQNTDKLWVIRCSVTYFVTYYPTSTTEKFLNREP